MTAVAVSRLADPGYHAVGGVQGLYLQVKPTGARSWVLRATLGGARREIGLGGYPAVSLAQARTAAVETRERGGPAPTAAPAETPLFRDMSETLLETLRPTWSNPKHADQWATTLRDYAYPVLGDMSVDTITPADVLRALRPIWTTKTETATRVRGRIEKVLDTAVALGLRPDNPARWKGVLSALLPAPEKIKVVRHMPAVSLGDAASVYAQIRECGGVSARALAWQVLTAVRSGEVRSCRWEHIDIKSGVWSIPAELMKMSRGHRVPLSTQAVALLRSAGLQQRGLVFPAPRTDWQAHPDGNMLSDMSLTKVMRSLGLEEVPHGWRSTFSDWCAERTAFSGEVREMCLAHAVRDKTEAAYRRGDMLDRRRPVMQAWADFVAGSGCGNEKAS